MTRTVVRVEEERDKKSRKGEGESGAAAAAEQDESPPLPLPEEQRSEGGMDDGEDDEEEEDDGMPPALSGPPLCTQDELLSEERAIERELRADASGHACWRDQQGKMIHVSEYRMVGLRKAKAVCEWLAEKLQVCSVAGRLCMYYTRRSPGLIDPRPTAHTHRTGGSTRA
jgi:hypothetical protein